MSFERCSQPDESCVFGGMRAEYCEVDTPELRTAAYTMLATVTDILDDPDNAPSNQDTYTTDEGASYQMKMFNLAESVDPAHPLVGVPAITTYKFERVHNAEFRSDTIHIRSSWRVSRSAGGGRYFMISIDDTGILACRMPQQPDGNPEPMTSYDYSALRQAVSVAYASRNFKNN